MIRCGLAWLLSVSGICFCALHLTGCRRANRSDVPVFAVSWTPLKDGASVPGAGVVSAEPGTFLMRQSGGEGGDFLLTRSEDRLLWRDTGSPTLGRPGATGLFPVYQYVPKNRALSLVEREAWSAATSEIIKCGYDGSAAVGLRLDPKDYKLSFQLQQVTTHGPLAVRARLSNDEKKVAILSADGPASEGWFAFTGGGGAKGQHYHQVMDLATREFLGQPVRISLTSAGLVESCWAPGDEYVVYYGSRTVVVASAGGAGTSRR
jgi:hypothetical protein